MQIARQEFALNHLSLGTRLAIIVLFGCLMTVGSVIYAAYSALLEDFSNNLLAQQENETAHISSLVSQDLEFRTNVLSQFAAILSSDGQLLSQEGLTNLLKKQKNLEKLFPHSLTVLTPDAVLIAENN